MKKLGVVITDGVGYRNFILSDFIKEAKQQFSEVIILSCLPKSAYDEIDLNCTIIELEVFEEAFPTWFFRKAKEVAHLQLHRNGNFGITDNFKANYSKNNTSRGHATRLIYKLTNFFHSEQWINRYNRWQQQTFKSSTLTQQYKQLLKTLQLDQLFFTHQRPPYIAPLVWAAEINKIPTTSFIFSWDNLASKGRMAATFDHYLVWSETMKKELLQYYTAISAEKVHVVGTPQFEPYVLARYGYTQEEFHKRFNLEASKPTILFSCGDVSTSPNDPVYIEAIAKAIKENKLCQSVNLLVRTSPAEEPKRFEHLANQYSFIQWNYPKWVQSRATHQESWSQRIPTVEDVHDLKSVLQHAAINVNMLSTMSLDFMLFEKPVINTVFGNGNNGMPNDQRFLHYAHIEYVIQSGATYVATDEEKLVDSINQALENPVKKGKEQEQLLNMQIGVPLEGTSTRIAETLAKWS